MEGLFLFCCALAVWLSAYILGLSVGRYKEQSKQKNSPEFITPRFLKKNNMLNFDGEEVTN
jgi:hypothetical protein